MHRLTPIFFSVSILLGAIKNANSQSKPSKARIAVHDTSYVVFHKHRTGSIEYQPVRSARLYQLLKKVGSDGPDLNKNGQVTLIETRLNYKAKDSSKKQDLQEIKRTQIAAPLITVTANAEAPGKPDTLKLTYVEKLNDSLKCLLKKGETIKNIFLEKLDIGELSKNSPNNKSLTIDLPLRFDQCIIDKFYDPIDRNVKNTKGVITADSLSFLKEVSFSNCSFLNDAILNDAKFEKVVVFTNIYSGSWADFLIFSNCIFKDSFFITQERDFLQPVYRMPKDRSTLITYLNGVIEDNTYFSDYYLALDNSIFLRPVTILNSSRILYISFDTSHFDGQVDLSFYHSSFSENYRPIWRAGLSPDYSYPFSAGKIPVENNLSFSACNFNKLLNLERSRLSEFYMRSCKIRDTLILYGTIIDTSINFPLAELRFQNRNEKNIVIVNPDKFSFESLGIRNYSVKQLYLPFINPDSDGDERQFNQKYNEFYAGLRESVKTVFANQDEIKDELVARFDYDRSKYDRIYDRKAGKYFSLIANYAIEATVRHGYHGEVNIIICSMAVIFLFALVYFFRDVNELDKFFEIVTSESKSRDRPRVNRASIRSRTLRPWKDGIYSATIRAAQCVWVSFYVFITPKFSTKFFKFQGSTFLIYMIEWLIGIFFIVLFLIYIASKYSFIKSLFGL